MHVLGGQSVRVLLTEVLCPLPPRFLGLHICFSASRPSETGRSFSLTLMLPISKLTLSSVFSCFAQGATSDPSPPQPPLLWGFHIHLELWCPLPGRAHRHPSGWPSEQSSLTADRPRNSESYPPSGSRA